MQRIRQRWWLGLAIGLAMGCGGGGRGGDGDAALPDGGVDLGPVRSALGDPCSDSAECASDHCVDGVCCDTACEGACSACVAAATGVASGTCAPVAKGADPADECAAGPCGSGACDGAGGCELEPTSVVCRASAGDCDLAESCDGVSPACPADGVIAEGTTCRARAGDCDFPEFCDGVNPACPADVVDGAGVVCRANAGPCDADEACDGVNPACPPDLALASGTPCRASANACDLADTCDGVTRQCADTFQTTDAPLCGPYRCAATAPTCLTSCTTEAQCAPGHLCLGGTCAVGRRAFVTSVLYPGNLGGLAGADAICQQHATSAGLSGTYEAWLSDSTGSANGRLEMYAGPYYRVLGGVREVVANSFYELVFTSLRLPIDTTEFGVARTSTTSSAWTGGDRYGTSDGFDCQGWTSLSSTVVGTTGNPTFVTRQWKLDVQRTCSSMMHLYCLEQGSPGG